MSTIKKLAKNSFIFFAGEVAMRIIAFFITLILARYLGSGEFGKYSLIYAFLSFFEIFMSVGIDPIVVRELSKDFQKGTEFVGNAITLKFFFSLLGLLLCWLTLQWIHYPADIKLLIYLSSLNMVFSFSTLFNDIFQAKLLMKYVAIITIAMKALLAVFTIMLIFLKAKLFHFVLINLLIYITQVILIYYQSKKIISIRVTMNLEVWKELLKYSWPLAINIFFISIYIRIDQILLFSMKGKEALGLYASAVKLAELPFIGMGAFMISVFPLFSEYARTAPDLFERIYQKSFKYSMIFIIPVAMMTSLYSRQITLTCYGQNFLGAQLSLAILIWSTVFVYGAVVHSYLLIATNLQFLDIVFTSSSAVLNVILNLILIPKYSLIGCAIATAISYGLGIPLSYSLKRTRRFAQAMVKSMIKPFLIALLVGCLIYFLSPLYFIINFILSGSIYLFILIFIKEINSEDIGYIKEIFAKSAI